MNLREHIAKPKYYTAILLTYNIDPIFFENIVLRDLHLSNISEIIIVCDKSQKNILIKYADSLKSLGKGYTLETANSIGRFHPKIFLKLGVESANLTLGSSNLSPGGWGNNFEMCSSVNVEPDDIQGCITITNIINQVKEFVQNENVLELINNIYYKYDWLNKSELGKKNDDSILLTPKFNTLFDKLKERTNNRQFESVTILTGSTDKSGSFLKECIDSFGVKKFNIYLTPSYSRFEEDSLRKLNTEINIYSVDKKYLHSKLYYFHGNDPLALIGSANCSRAAWLISPNNGGNVESIAFLPTMNENDLTNILDILPNTLLKFNQIKTWGDNVENKPEDFLNNDTNNLLSISYDSSTSNIVVTFKIAIELTSELTLKYDNNIYKPLREQNLKIFNFFVDFKTSTKTQFAEVCILHNETVNLYKRWIDDINQLKYLNKGSSLFSSINRLSKNVETSELDSLRKDIESIKNIIIKGDLIFDDTNVFTKRKVKGDNINQDETIILTPNDLVGSLNYESSFNIGSENIHNNHYTVSLFGIERIFFGSDITNRINEDENNEDINDEQTGNIKEDTKNDKGTKSKDLSSYIIKTEKIIDKFIEGISNDTFASKCTALQLSQAISFPLALSYFGFYKQHYSINQIEKWFYNLLNILYFQSYDDNEAFGLLKCVRNKYVKNEREDIFDEIIGNGVILILLELIVCKIYEKTKYTNNISIIFYINTLMKNNILTASTGLNQFNSLISQSNFEEMKKELNLKFPLINEKFIDLENHILDSFDELITRNSSNKSNENDIIFGKKYGWGITKSIHESKKSNEIYWDVYFPRIGSIKSISLKNYYINLNSLLNNNIDINESINAIFV